MLYANIWHHNEDIKEGMRQKINLTLAIKYERI